MMDLVSWTQIGWNVNFELTRQSKNSARLLHQVCFNLLSPLFSLAKYFNGAEQPDFSQGGTPFSLLENFQFFVLVTESLQGKTIIIIQKNCKSHLLVSIIHVERQDRGIPVGTSIMQCHEKPSCHRIVLPYRSILPRIWLMVGLWHRVSSLLALLQDRLYGAKPILCHSSTFEI